RATKVLTDFYLDQVSFEAAAPGLVAEDFSTAAVAPDAVIGCGSPVRDGNACFEPGGLAPGLAIASSSGRDVVALGAGTLGATTPLVGADVFADSVIVEFDAPETYAVGLELGVAGSAESLQIAIEAADGTPIATTTAPVSDVMRFWGVIASEPIGRITLTSPSRQGEVIDRVQFGASGVDTAFEDFENGRFDAAWRLAGVGHANQEMVAVVDDAGNRELALTSDGATAYLGADNAGFLYQELTGDFRIEADLDTWTMTTGKAWRKAGLMVRASLDHFDVRLLAMHAPVQGKLQFVAREVYGGPGNVKVALETPATGALRLAIERVDQELTVQYSLDGGATWITPSTGLGGSIDLPTLPPTLYVGLAMVSNNISVTSTALFDNVSITQLAP
ncbi:MAG: hypothetical protein AAGE94_23310, partial [Acidobacteriota bacterium]